MMDTSRKPNVLEYEIAILLIILVWIVLVLTGGAVAQFLWNNVVVDGLRLTKTSISYWTGIGIVFLLSFIGAFLNRASK